MRMSKTMYAPFQAGQQAHQNHPLPAGEPYDVASSSVTAMRPNSLSSRLSNVADQHRGHGEYASAIASESLSLCCLEAA
eukprot:scaffold49314_cov40-Prasinocladus_malaysianus.AAC.1